MLHPALAHTCRIGFASPQAEQAETLTPINVAPSLQDFLRETDLHILDDFLPDPAAWRAQALNLPFEQQRYAGQNYPGSQTAGQPSQAIMERIATALGRLSASQDETHWQTQSIRHCVNLATKTTSRAAQCLGNFIAFRGPRCTSVGPYDGAVNANMLQVSLAYATL